MDTPQTETEGATVGRSSPPACSTSMAEMCLAEIRALLPREWEPMEITWCILELIKDKKRLDWMEKQAGHVFDKGQGDYRRIWKSGDPRTVRGEIDDMVKEEVEIYKSAMS